MRRKNKTKPSDESLLLASIDAKTDKYGVMILARLNITELERDQAIKELEFIRTKLVSLLSEEQLDVALGIGCDPMVYAIECIEMYKEKFFPNLSSAKSLQLAMLDLAKQSRYP